MEVLLTRMKGWPQKIKATTSAPWPEGHRNWSQQLSSCSSSSMKSSASMRAAFWAKSKHKTSPCHPNHQYTSTHPHACTHTHTRGASQAPSTR